MILWEQLGLLWLVGFLLEMGALIPWCDGVCLVGPVEHPMSAADLRSPLLWAQGNVFT